jgi:hypothetical protein
MKSIVQQLFNFQESTKGFHFISCGLGDVKTISALNLDHKAKKNIHKSMNKLTMIWSYQSQHETKLND